MKRIFERTHFENLYEMDSEIIANENNSKVLFVYPNYILPAQFLEDNKSKTIGIIEHSSYINRYNNISDFTNISIHQDIHLPNDLNYLAPNKYDLILFHRIIEHLTVYDWSYLFYCLALLLEKGGRLYVTYPDMDEITNLIKSRPDKYEFYNIELFNPSGDIYDLHKSYTNTDIIAKYATMEGLLTVVEYSELFSIGHNRKVYRTLILEKC